MATPKKRTQTRPAQPVIPEPPRTLLGVGSKLWNEVHSRGEVRGNIEPLLMLCERLDERTRLRTLVFTNDDPADRAGLRALEAQIDESLERLGLRTLLPANAAVHADDWTVKLAAVEG